MECLCGEKMTLIMESEELRLWSCQPTGCGRLLLESKGGSEISGTWYTPEQNMEERQIF